jgi:hypothetical protein
VRDRANDHQQADKTKQRRNDDEKQIKPRACCVSLHR